MSNLTLITYGTTFLVTSGALNYASSTIKSCLPQIDIKSVEAISPTLASIASGASVAYDVTALAATIYTATYIASGALTTVAGLEALAGMNMGELLPIALNNIGAPALAEGAQWIVGYRSMDLAPLATTAIANILPINLTSMSFVFTAENFGFIGSLFETIKTATETASFITDALFRGEMLETLFAGLDITGLSLLE